MSNNIAPNSTNSMMQCDSIGNYIVQANNYNGLHSATHSMWVGNPVPYRRGQSIWSTDPISLFFNYIASRDFPDDWVMNSELGTYCLSEYVTDTPYASDVANRETCSPFISWWPLQSVWRTSGMKVGYWTPSLKEWFVKGHTDILAGKAQPKNSTQWRKELSHRVADIGLILKTAQVMAVKSSLPHRHNDLVRPMPHSQDASELHRTLYYNYTCTSNVWKIV